MEIPWGIYPRAETGMGRNVPPMTLTGTGMGSFFPHGDGDGKVFPDGELPVDILKRDLHNLAASVPQKRHHQPML